MTNKKILIIGPVSDFGGREVEVQLISKFLVNRYKVELISTISIGAKSDAIIKHNNFQWSSVQRLIYKGNLLIRASSWLAKHYNNRKESADYFISNFITNKYVNFEQKIETCITKKMIESDIIIYSGELTSKWLKEVINICNSNSKPLMIRTTGTIKFLPSFLSEKIYNKHIFLVHSTANKIAIDTSSSLKTSIIDQASLSESKLLTIKLGLQGKDLVYGFLGRFGKEKGILEILQIFNKNNKHLVIAGNGPFKSQVENYCLSNALFTYLGELKPEDIYLFFNKIDVLIIPSFEEAGPLVGIEAMAAGKLIVSTRVGAMPDRLKDGRNSFWFDIKKEQSLLDVLEKIESMDRNTLLELKEENRKHYIKKYSFNVIASQYQEQIKNLIN